MKLSLAMIVKNDKDNIIRCLKSCSHIFDEIVVVDTGSTDGTIDALLKFNRTVDVDLIIEHFDWIDDFAAARNYAFSKCTGDWVMWLDSDDVLKKPGCIRDLFDKCCKDSDAILIPYHYASDANGKPFINLTRERIVKRELAHWIYPIHECMEMKFSKMFTTYDDDYAVTHMRSEQAFLSDRGRNLAILEKNFSKFPNDHRYIYYYGNELRDAGKSEKAIEMYESLDKIGGFLEEKYLAHVSAAICHMQLKNPPAKAIEHLNQAISLCPQYYDAYYVLGTVYDELGSFDRSIMMFEICARSQFKKMDLTNREDIKGYKPFEYLERLYGKIGDYKKCLVACEKLLEYFPVLPSLLHDRGFCRDRIIEKNMEKVKSMGLNLIFLDLGAGAKRVPGYITCDKYDKEADLNFDMTFIPFLDKSVDRIRSEHSLEHLTMNDSKECLRECFRVMKPGAVLELEIPNFEESACDFIGNAKRGVNQVSEWYSKTIWGRQYTDNKVDLGQFHTCGFTREYIKSLLRNAGFQVISIHDTNKYGTPSMEIIAVRMVKMYYYDTGDESSATCRLRRYPIHSSNVKDVPLWVIRLNMLPDPSHETMLKDADIVMFTSYHAETMKLLLNLRGKTQRWFDHNEGIFFCTEVMPVLKEIDTIVCCSEKLSQMTEEALGQKDKCVVLRDTYEHTLNGEWR